MALVAARGRPRPRLLLPLPLALAAAGVRAADSRAPAEAVPGRAVGRAGGAAVDRQLALCRTAVAGAAAALGSGGACRAGVVGPARSGRRGVRRPGLSRSHAEGSGA